MSSGSLENTVKELILKEALSPGERVTEAALAARLGVSRTPIRNLLPRLAAEGFLRPVGKRGYVVAEFGDREIFQALDLRALLEGWAARELAENGADEDLLLQLDECLKLGDALFEGHRLDRKDELEYGKINGRFHDLIIKGCESEIVDNFIERLNIVPFVAPAVIVFDQLGPRAAFEILHWAHGFHHSIVDAIKNRDGSRAEFLFREHANHQRLSMFERRRSNDERSVLSRPPAKGTRKLRTRSRPR